ncbi:hypothetical protein WA026_016759 [Henosepilachna vigintioctopunctata]|uniref:Uncharacterized protein n=1 Tax=Henosepilachna vigintioctopunctata TaxID=420089 RepID=A0AAW1V014_9CUCU
MKDRCKCEKPKGPKPNVVLTNIDNDMKREHIIEAIVNQNKNSTKADEEVVEEVYAYNVGWASVCSLISIEPTNSEQLGISLKLGGQKHGLCAMYRTGMAYV